MKKVGNDNSISVILIFSLALMLNFSLTSSAQEAPKTPAASVTATAPSPSAGTAAPAPAAAAGDPVKGKALFNANCAACHKLDSKATGPALRNVSERHDMAWIYKWVHNSSEVIKSGDAAAVKLFNENNKAVMTPFPQLATTDIDNIIAYTSEPKSEAKPGTALPPGMTPLADQDSGVSNNMILGALAFV